MESIMDVARDRGLAEMEGLVLASNSEMLKLMKRLGFSVKRFAEDPEFKLVRYAL
jgi:acetyltransferase